MKIALIGAMDRNNYGDLLFPIIFEKAISKRLNDVDFDYYGYKESDLSKIGAKSTDALKNIINKQYDAVVIVGGEVLTSPWSLTYLFLQENLFKSRILGYLNRLICNRFTLGILDNLSQRIYKILLRGISDFPWLFKKADFKNSKIKIIYNSVGGAADKFNVKRRKRYLLNNLSEADLISVREHASKTNLIDIGLENIKESPDSAFLLSEIFPMSSLKELKSIEYDLESNYIVFQIGQQFASYNITIIVEELKKILDDNIVEQIVLLPIGYAALHEDIEPLKKIQRILEKKVDNCKSVLLVENNTIFDTMSIIANSQLFMGTSLHGNVTALAYGVPCLGLDPRVVKLKELLKMYSIENQVFGLPYDRMFAEVKKALGMDKCCLINNSRLISQKVNDSFDEIASILSCNVTGSKND